MFHNLNARCSCFPTPYFDVLLILNCISTNEDWINEDFVFLLKVNLPFKLASQNKKHWLFLSYSIILFSPLIWIWHCICSYDSYFSLYPVFIHQTTSGIYIPHIVLCWYRSLECNRHSKKSVLYNAWHFLSLYTEQARVRELKPHPVIQKQSFAPVSRDNVFHFLFKEIKQLS